MRKITVIILAMVFVLAMSSGAMAAYNHNWAWADDAQDFEVKFDTPKQIEIKGLGDMDFGTVFETGATAVEDFYAEVDSAWNEEVWVNLNKKLKIRHNSEHIANVNFNMKPQDSNAATNISLPTGTITPGERYDIEGEITEITTNAIADGEYSGTATLTVSYFDLR